MITGLDHIAIAVRVPTQLQPTPELAVVRQQEAAAIFTRYPGRCGDVPRKTLAIEAVGVFLDQRARLGGARFVGMPPCIAFDEVEKRTAQHGMRS